MITLDQAVACVLSRATPLAVEKVELDACLGRVLAVDVGARWDLPVGDLSAMDGYALRTADVLDATREAPVALELVGQVHAGERYEGTLGAGQAIRIMTGAPVPEGADAVLRQELVTREGSRLVVPTPVLPGHDMRRKGEDVRAGERLLSAGSVLSPEAIAVLAAFGLAEVSVVRRPRVTIVATGDELVTVAEASPERIVDSNGPMLAAMVRRAGGVARRPPIVADRRDAIADALRSATSEADLVVSIGGASVGDKDHLRGVLAELGFEESFWKVALKPGKPSGFGMLAGTPFFALPGNPRAAAVAFALLVEPFLRRRQGVVEAPRLRGALTRAVAMNGERTQALRARVTNDSSGLRVEIPAGQNSGRVTSPLATNALALIPQAEGVRRAAEDVELILDGPLTDAPRIPVLCFVGPSNTGKTTIVSRLVKALCRDFELGVIKHGHHFALDREGKDSHRYRQAGARTVAVASPNDHAIMSSTREPSTLAEMVRRLPAGLDAVFVEGFKQEGESVIEVHRAGHPMLCREGRFKEVLAVVTDCPAEVPPGLPTIGHDDHEELERFVRAYLRRGAGEVSGR